MELTIVMPCLNEGESLPACLNKAINAIKTTGTQGEIIVADNGSSDGSQAIATAMGARLINVTPRGYGKALMGGITASTGKFIIIGDSDNSYDFHEIPKFLSALHQGSDFVIGCRLPAAGGRIMPGAMPLLHKCLGNPLLTLLAHYLFGTPFHDICCGMRGFSKAFIKTINLNSTGMEFAIEMAIKCGMSAHTTMEVPITYYRDTRKSHPPHLRTFKDGWRLLSYMLSLTKQYSPLRALPLSNHHIGQPARSRQGNSWSITPRRLPASSLTSLSKIKTNEPS
jgi:glycosyltransferase involved in cell wall biosynthesis